MCEICHYVPCLSGCPNAPDPPAAFTCYDCGEGIHPGDEYADINGLKYCESCVESLPYCILIPLLGGKWKVVPEGKTIKCSDCGDILPAGTEYGVIDGKILCEDCVDEIPYCELVTRMGHDWNKAESEDIYDGYDC